MIKFSVGQRKLLAGFLANIGVAWFAAGVIGIFIGEAKTSLEVIISLA